MKIIDINTWNRKHHFNHFKDFKDPYFGVVIAFDVTNAYSQAKSNGYSFFARYLHDCMKAINAVENLKYRIENGKVVVHDIIHASSTMMRDDNTFGFSFITFSESLTEFIKSIEKEKFRIQNTIDLYPPKNSQDCIHCSAMPWSTFTGHKEPVSGLPDSVPKLAFSKIEHKDKTMIMNVAINVNHALVDGYHIGLFQEKFQKYLNQ